MNFSVVAARQPYTGNEWVDAPPAEDGDDFDGVIDTASIRAAAPDDADEHKSPPQSPDQKQQQHNSNNKKKKKRKLKQGADGPAPKRRRVSRSRSPFGMDAGVVAAAEAEEEAAAAEAKNGAAGRFGDGGGLKNEPLIDPVTGVPNWKRVDADEQFPSDNPEWIPMLGMGIDQESMHSNVWLKDWLKAARDLFGQCDILTWATQLQHLYRKDLYTFFTAPEDEDKEQHPFYKSAIFAYFDKHNQQAWFSKNLQLIKLKHQVSLVERELFAMDGGRVVAVSKDNIASYEKLLKLKRQAEEDVNKVKR